jgi:predicted murein hydrolase (TIGR00659 family)
VKEIVANVTTFGVVLSILAYEIGLAAKRKLKLSFINPLLVSILLVIGFLAVFQIEYETYKESAQYITYLLTPATVSLAIPLYQQIDLLKKNFVAIFAGIFAGVVTSLVTIFVMSYLFGLNHAQYVTLLPKSITTAIGISVTEELGGYPSITAAVIIITGILGNVTAEWFLGLVRIKSPVSKGLAIGTAAHAVGTAKAMELGEEEGAMSSLAIVVAGLCTVAVVSLFSNLI